ncbi:MAG: DEAD/DEAH box helicase family protein, partial [Patescibacteria group bacterium]
MPAFKLHSPFQPTGDQPAAIAKLVSGLRAGHQAQTLLGVTGSGKTFTMANVIAELNQPALIISHNKTLAAQLASEFKDFFPHNAVDYFVSYYDYYQPEAYMPQKDLYIEKESQINEEIDRLRNAATRDLLSRRDVIIVASVSCIYGLGSPTAYRQAAISVARGQRLPRLPFLRQLNSALYQRNDYDLTRGTYRVRGEVIDIVPAYAQDLIRLEFDDHALRRISTVDQLTGRVAAEHQRITIFPGRQFVTQAAQLPAIAQAIRAELAVRVKEFERLHKPLEAERIAQRTNFDLEMLLATGLTSGIENYSRYFDFRQPG